MFRPLALLLLLWLPLSAQAQLPAHTRTDDVIYGRKFGMCLTLDVFTPKKDANGLGVIYCVSSGWMSDKRDIPEHLIAPFTARGFTVFAALHSSNPKFAVNEIVYDMHRAVRFVRHRAKQYRVDPDKLGIVGHSSGGQLALMQAFAPEEGDKTAADPVDRESSKVAMASAFSAPTDFLNWGKEGDLALGNPKLPGLYAPFQFAKLVRETLSFEVERDEKRRLEIGRSLSPVTRATKTAPPVLLVHGAKDNAVPPQQSERLAARLKELGVPHEHIVKKDAGHNWAEMDNDMAAAAEWFAKQALK
jgi:acetyl esterase/lipase